MPPGWWAVILFSRVGLFMRHETRGLFDFTLLVAQRLKNHIDPDPDIIMAWMMDRTFRGEGNDDVHA